LLLSAVLASATTAFADKPTATTPIPPPVATDIAYQVHYASNLSIGDSVINITNTGARGAAAGSGTTASVTGSLCVNVYVFDAAEEMVACCSCPVTPNGLVSLSARNDLISNTLTPGVPTSIVIKLLTTVPVNNSCTNSAGAVTTATHADGLAAWGTTLHANTTTAPITYGVTETSFKPSTLSAGELNRLGTSCNFIQSTGSGFGICRSCRLGGL
jgi:hypothetical protein